MSSSSIFNGEYVKLLKSQLKLKDSARILTGADDPTSIAKDGETGSIYLKQQNNTIVPESFEAPAPWGQGGSIYELAAYNNEIYAGGSFSSGIIKFNGTSWVSIGSLNSNVVAFAVYNGSLYIGGFFTNAAGLSGADYIVKWDGASFSRVGVPNALNGRVYALHVYDGSLYLGGEFTNAAGLSGANYIVKWDGTSFTKVGTNGLSNQVRSFGEYNSNLYVGGMFTNAGGIVGADYIASWNGTSFASVGSLNALNARVLTIGGYGSDLYLGGEFTNAAGLSGADYIVKWDGASFSRVGSAGAFSAPAAIFSLKEYSNELYIGGYFLNAAGLSGADYIVKWNGASFSRVGSAGAFNLTVDGFAVNGGNLYIGGGFSNALGIANADAYVIYTASYSISSPAKIYTKTDNGITTNWKELVDAFNDQSIAGQKTFTTGAQIKGSSGAVVPAGYVGEQLVATWTGQTINTSATTLATINGVQPGVYLFIIETDCNQSTATRITSSIGGTATISLTKTSAGGDYVRTVDQTFQAAGAAALYATYYGRVTSSGTVIFSSTSSGVNCTNSRGSFSLVRIA